MKKTFNNIENVSLFLHTNLKKNTNILISGGRTIHSLLKKLKFLKKKLYFKSIVLSDERIVKMSSSLRNDKILKKFIKSKTLYVKRFINYRYEKIKINELKKISKKISKIRYHYGLLSLGSNCHLASLFDFNNHNSLNFYHVNNSPKKPKNRVTVSKKIIMKCEKIFLIVEYKNKKNELKKVFKLPFFKKIKKKITLIVY